MYNVIVFSIRVGQVNLFVERARCVLAVNFKKIVIAVLGRTSRSTVPKNKHPYQGLVGGKKLTPIAYRLPVGAMCQLHNTYCLPIGDRR